MFYMQVFVMLLKGIFIFWLFIFKFLLFGFTNNHLDYDVQLDDYSIDTDESDFFSWTNYFIEKSSISDIDDFPEMDDIDSLTWSSNPVAFLNPSDVPICEEIDLVQNIDIIDIEDTLVNCSNVTWFSYYDNAWIWWLESLVMIYKNMFTRWFQDFWTWTICYSDKTDFNLWIDDNSLNFINFLKNHKINEKWLIVAARDKLGVPYEYFCADKNLCDSLNWETWWEANWHYYVYWFRSYETTGTPLLIIDDKLYKVWKAELLENSELLKQWIRNVIWLDRDRKSVV